MSELLYCQKEEITPIADALRELCNTDELMSLVSMRARIGDVAAEVQEQTDLICQIAEVYDATPSTEESTMEGNTELLKGLLWLAENNVGNVTLPELSNEGSAGDLLKGKQLIDGDGQIVTGTIESKNNDNIIFYPEAGVVTVEPGFYKEYGYNVLPSLNYTTQIENDNGQAQVKLTTNSGCYMKPTTDIEIPLGTYQTNVNYTFNDIVSTPHNISKGYVATESSVQIAPAVVSEVETQTLLIDRILTAVNSLPPQSPPEIIPPSEPEPEPEPTGDLTFVLSDGTVLAMDQITNVVCSSGTVEQIKLGNDILWEYDLFKDSELLLASTTVNFEIYEEWGFSYSTKVFTLTREITMNDEVVVIFNGIPLNGEMTRSTGSNDQIWIDWESENGLITLSSNVNGETCSRFSLSVDGAIESATIEIYCIN